MITSELLDDILLEWSYRLKDGIPDVNDPGKIEVLNEVLAEYKLPLYESDFKMAGITGATEFSTKYYDKWIQRIEDGGPFKSLGKDYTIPKNSDFYKKLKATNGDPQKLLTLFVPDGKYAAEIPGPGTAKIKLTQVSKDPFTAKVTTSGLTNLNTADAKEGMVVYFYACTDAELESVSKKIFLETPSAQLKLDKNKANVKYLGSKAKSTIDNVIDFLNKETIDKKQHETEIEFLLNAFSAAYTIRSVWGESYVLDRGDLFTDIRKTASQITNVKPDKWCPGDVYLYVDESRSKDIQQEANTTKQLVTVKDGGKTINGINTIFDTEDPAAVAISLKEESALAGGATEFLNIEKLLADDIGDDVVEGRFSKEEKEIVNNIDIAEKQNTTVKNVDALLNQYQSEHVTLIGELENDIKSKGKIKNVVLVAGTKTGKVEDINKNKQLYNLIKKNVGLRSMIEFFDNFDKISKKLASKNPVIAKYKNPLAALTAFGVSLSGFNPTFYKVVASKKGSMGHIDEFKGRDTLEMLDDTVEIIDSPSKAGYQILYKSKMGKKTYQTTLDVRFKSRFEFTITVQEFKEK